MLLVDCSWIKIWNNIMLFLIVVFKNSLNYIWIACQACKLFGLSHVYTYDLWGVTPATKVTKPLPSSTLTLIPKWLSLCILLLTYPFGMESCEGGRLAGNRKANNFKQENEGMQKIIRCQVKKNGNQFSSSSKTDFTWVIFNISWENQPWFPGILS